MAVMAAFSFDGTGNATALEVEGKTHADLEALPGVFVWVHLNRPDGSPPDWLDEAGLDQVVMDALSAPETRPRCTVHDLGVLMNLRGVNLSEGAEPEDMVSLRLWITERLVISVQRRRLFAIGDVIDASLRNVGPHSAGDLIARMAVRLADRAEPVVADLNERIDDLEAVFEQDGQIPVRGDLADIRRVSIVLRRYMFPQRDALSTFEIEDLPWLAEKPRMRLREATERVTRLAEDLDSLRDRAQVVHDQIMDLRAEVMNRQMLVLSVVAAVFLPLGLLTGLLGINVGGVPGANDPWAFWMVCLLLLVIGAGQFWLFRRLGLLKG